MNRADITATPSLVGQQSPTEQRISTAADERITDRMVLVLAGGPIFQPTVQFGIVQALRCWPFLPLSFTAIAVGMGLAFAFFAGALSLLMALREWHPFLIGVATFFACGSVVYFTAAAWSFYHRRL
jgi:hypothetical protein